MSWTFVHGASTHYSYGNLNNNIDSSTTVFLIVIADMIHFSGLFICCVFEPKKSLCHQRLVHFDFILDGGGTAVAKRVGEQPPVSDRTTASATKYSVHL